MATIKDVLDMFRPAIEQIERTFGWSVMVDLRALEEVAIKAEETLGQLQGISHPNTFKVAGHYAFWVRKLKPFGLLRANELSNQLTALGVAHDEAGLAAAEMTAQRPVVEMFCNEIIAFVVACGIAERYGAHVRVKCTPALFNDLCVGLRYHVYSPSSLAILPEGMAQ